jgi:hypothetical protein
MDCAIAARSSSDMARCSWKMSSSCMNNRKTYGPDRAQRNPG